MTGLKSSISSRSISNIKTSVQAVQTDFDSVKTAAKGLYTTQLDGVQSSLQGLHTAVGNLGNGKVVQNVTAVKNAASAVETSVSNLVTMLNPSCGT